MVIPDPVPEPPPPVGTPLGKAIPDVIQTIRQLALNGSPEEMEAIELELATSLADIRKQMTGSYDDDFPANAVAVIGAGLAGLSAALTLLDEGVSVLLVDKNDYFGGNSAYASSGINGGWTARQRNLSIADSAEVFFRDTLKSAARDEDSLTGRLARVLADKSAEAVEWVGSRAGVDLSDVGRLGGHSVARTHRPVGRLTGAAFISGLERAVLKYENTGLLHVLRGTRVVKLPCAISHVH